MWLRSWSSRWKLALRSRGTVIATWITRKFKGKVQRLTINRREIDFDGDGNVSRIVEEEIKLRKS